MATIDSIAALEALYGAVSPAARVKVVDRLTPSYRAWIEQSRFCVLATVGPEGTDASPRGDPEQVVTVADEGTLLLPDWKGNNRIDSLRNIVRDGRVSVMFLVEGSDLVLRVNGRARISTDPALIARFATDKGAPATVVMVTIGEVYAQCPKSLIRAGLWAAGDRAQGLPGMPEMLREAVAQGAAG